MKITFLLKGILWSHFNFLSVTRTKRGSSLMMNFLFLGVLKRCYSCRSRGELGNCKDPFPANGTAKPTAVGEEPKLLRGVETIPCASGWCIKLMEGGSTFKDDGMLMF